MHAARLMQSHEHMLELETQQLRVKDQHRQQVESNEEFDVLIIVGSRIGKFAAQRSSRNLTVSS